MPPVSNSLFLFFGPLFVQVLSISWDVPPFGYNRHEPKRWGAAVPLLGGELGSHLTQCGLGRGLPPYQVASWSIQPFGHNTWAKIWGLMPPFFGGGEAESPCNTMSPGPRPTSIPSGILIHAALRPQQTWAKIGDCAPFGGGELGRPLRQCGWSRGLPPCQVSFWCIKTVWPQYTNVIDRQDRTDRQNNGLIAQGEPFYKRSPKNGSPYAIGPLSCLSVLSVTLVYGGQTVGWIKMKLGT